MAIIGKIRKHSGLAVIIIGVAIAAFVIGDFGKKQYRGTDEIGVVNGENIPYVDFNQKVEQALEAQKENTGTDKITEQEAYTIRQNTWNSEVKNVLMGAEYEELGLTVSSDELFDQIQGKQPHRYILQYFKDPKTGQYDPALVLNYLKNLDKMEPKNKEMWLRFEKAIKEDRQETKFNNLISKGYYVPATFLKKDYENKNKALKVRYIAPLLTGISDSTVKISDDDYQTYYDKNKVFFFQEDAYRDVDYVAFEVTASDSDRKKTAQDVQQLYKDFCSTTNILNFTNANSDKKSDTVFVKKGTFPPNLDSVLFNSPKGTLIQPFEFNNAWYMAKLVDVQDRPDSMSGSQILVAFAGGGNETIKRTKEQAKVRADSILLVLKKSPDKFAEIARTVSDYPNAKDDGGDLKWFTDGDPNLHLFFKNGLEMKPKDIKVLETRIGYSIFMLSQKTKPVKKVLAAVLIRNIEPSNQTYQDTYLKASAFAGQNKTPESFDKASAAQGLQKRSSPNLREMDNALMGLQSAREIVRWAYAEKTAVGEVSPVFDISGKYIIALLKKASQKGQQPLESVKERIEPAVKNMKKIQMLAENMKKETATIKDINALAAKLVVKIDTAVLNFSGFGRVQLARENELVGQLFNMSKGLTFGPVAGNYGAYYVVIDDFVEPPAKEDYTLEKAQALQNFSQKVGGSAYRAIEKQAKITDNRTRFY
jgi:peptidyl-prolyl cis-trans isomerase D